MASVEGSNEIEFVDRVAGLRVDRGGHARWVHLVHLVCLVDLVCLVGFVQANKRDQSDKPNNSLLMLADGFTILLVEW